MLVFWVGKMQNVVEVKYVWAQGGDFRELIALLNKVVNEHLKEGWALNGGITMIGHDGGLTKIIQPMIKQEQSQSQSQEQSQLLPARR